MTHREVVILSPQRGITVNRNQMEAHLMLHGWEPFNVAQGAAIKGELVVFGIDEKSGGHNTGRVLVRQDALSGLNLTDPAKVRSRSLGMWFMSDKYFWPVAHRCAELDNEGINDGLT